MPDITNTPPKLLKLDPKIRGAACTFSDTFQIHSRTDGMYLLEFFCHVPDGYQSNMLTMVSKSSLEKLRWLIDGMLNPAPQPQVDLPVPPPS